METIHIVSVPNDRYAPHLAVMFTSILLNHHTENPLQFYVIDGGSLSSASKARLTAALEAYQHKPVFLQIDRQQYNKYFVDRHITHEAFYRLSIPSLLDPKIHKAIYLDCDLIVNEDIVNLWNIDVSDYLLGAIQDDLVESDYQAPGISMARGYFNSGVLLLNLAKWREQEVIRKALAYLDSYTSQLKYHDQDVLNAVVSNNWVRVSKTWNWFACQLLDNDTDPAVIHFNSPDKPWCGNPPRQLDYFKYSEFCHFVP